MYGFHNLNYSLKWWFKSRYTFLMAVHSNIIIEFKTFCNLFIILESQLIPTYLHSTWFLEVAHQLFPNQMNKAASGKTLVCLRMLAQWKLSWTVNTPVDAKREGSLMWPDHFLNRWFIETVFQKGCVCNVFLSKTSQARCIQKMKATRKLISR